MNRACNEVNGFLELIQRFERNISIQGKSPRTFDNYARYIAAMALHFKTLPTELEPEQVKDYLYELQQRSKTLQGRRNLIIIAIFGQRRPPQDFLFVN